MKIPVFEFVNAITLTKVDLIAEHASPALAEKDYVPFLVNRSLSYFFDTARIANEMNRCHHIDNALQFRFLLHIVPKRRRISKWHKKAADESVEVIQQYYKCSRREAEEYSSLLTPDQVGVLRQRMFTGGVVRHGATKA
jgi:hypothetical protein